MDDSRLYKDQVSIRLALRLLESPMFTKSSSPIFRRADVPYSCNIDADWPRIAHRRYLLLSGSHPVMLVLVYHQTLEKAQSSRC